MKRTCMYPNDIGDALMAAYSRAYDQCLADVVTNAALVPMALSVVIILVVGLRGFCSRSVPAAPCPDSGSETDDDESESDSDESDASSHVQRAIVAAEADAGQDAERDALEAERVVQANSEHVSRCLDDLMDDCDDSSDEIY